MEINFFVLMSKQESFVCFMSYSFSAAWPRAAAHEWQSINK